MVLLASGDPTDSLLMTFRIEGQDRVLYSDSFVVDRGDEWGRSDEEWDTTLEFWGGFFADRKFERIGAFAEHGYVKNMNPPVHIEIIRQARIRSVELRLVESGLSARKARLQAWWEVPGDMQLDTAAAQTNWGRMLQSDVLVFRYSPGWDRVYSLAWSEELGQFVDMFPCC